MTATTTKSRKAKGRRLQQTIRDSLRETFKESLSSGDIESRGMGQQGTDIILSPLGKDKIKFDFEIKNQEQWLIPNWWSQTISNTEEGRKPALVIAKNRQEPLVIIRFDDFLELLFIKE